MLYESIYCITIMVEAMPNSIKDFIVDNISYKLKPRASFINERRNMTFLPSCSNIYSASGTELGKLQLTGDHFMNPSTFRVMFDVVNQDTVANEELRVLGGPGSFFRRARPLCGGVCIEDIDDHNRVEQCFLIRITL